jgi:hypothetical protein
MASPAQFSSASNQSLGQPVLCTTVATVFFCVFVKLVVWPSLLRHAFMQGFDLRISWLRSSPMFLEIQVNILWLSGNTRLLLWAGEKRLCVCGSFRLVTSLRFSSPHTRSLCLLLQLMKLRWFWWTRVQFDGFRWLINCAIGDGCNEYEGQLQLNVMWINKTFSWVLICGIERSWISRNLFLCVTIITDLLEL